MVKKELVPVGGSEKNKLVFAYANYPAGKFDFTVYLAGAGTGRKSRRVNCLLDEYIYKTAEGLRANNSHAAPDMIYIRPAEKIHSCNKKNVFNRMIRGTYRRSNSDGRIPESIADRVLHESEKPVRLVRSSKMVIN